MTWTALADSGIGFTPNLPEGVTITGSTIKGVRLDSPGDQSWTITLASAAKIRVTVKDFNSNYYQNSGAFVFGYAGGVSEMIQNEGGISEWSPNPVVSGAAVTYVAYDPGEQSDYPHDSYTMLVEVDVVACPRRVAAGRNTTNVVSEYTRDRVHYGVLYYPETQRLTDRLRAIIPECATVVSARWTTYEILTCVMSDPQIDGTDVSICIKAQVAGNCRIRSDVTLSNGQTLSMWHVITVPEAPFMPGDVWVQGPYFVEATVTP
jgi:hypothetical protein